MEMPGTDIWMFLVGEPQQACGCSETLGVGVAGKRAGPSGRQGRRAVQHGGRRQSCKEDGVGSSAVGRCLQLGFTTLGQAAG